MRRPEAPLRPGIGDDRPANRERTASHDDPCQPDCPRPQTRGVQCYYHGVGCRRESQREADERRTDRGWIESRPTPPAPHPPEARPAGASLLGRQGPGQCGRGDALGDQETQHSPGDGGYNRGVCIAEYLLDPLIDRRLSYLCGRHDCSLLPVGGVVTRTVYDDRIPMSSGQRWPLPRVCPTFYTWRFCQGCAARSATRAS